MNFLGADLFRPAADLDGCFSVRAVVAGTEKADLFALGCKNPPRALGKSRIAKVKVGHRWRWCKRINCIKALKKTPEDHS